MIDPYLDIMEKDWFDRWLAPGPVGFVGTSKVHKYSGVISGEDTGDELEYFRWKVIQ